MEKIDFSKLKLASSSFTDRIKTTGGEISRSIGSKVKELLQSPTPESKIVDEATDDSLSDPNWGLNLRVCAAIQRGDYNGAEIVRAIKRKLGPGRSPVGQRLGLELLEACCSNCEKVFSEVASEKVVEDVARLVEDYRTEEGVRVKAMEMVRGWGESEELAYLPVFRQTYMQLKSRPTPAAPEEMLPTPQYNLESYLDQPPLSPPERYPIPNTGSENAEDATFISYDFQSVEEKKEFLLVTRNTLDLLSSILNSETEPKPLKDDDLTRSMLEKCKQSLPVVQRIIQNTTDDEVMLFDALNIHDELQQAISRHGEMSAASDLGEPNGLDNAGELSADSDPIAAISPHQRELDTTEKTEKDEAGVAGSDKPNHENSADIKDKANQENSADIKDKPSLESSADIKNDEQFRKP